MHGTRHSCSMSPLLHVLTLATCLARLGCGAQQSLQPADTSLFSLDGVLQPGDQGELGEDTGEQEEVPDKQEVVPEEQEEVPEEQEVPDEEEEVPDEQEEGSRVRVTESGAVVRSQVTEQGRVVNIDQADLTLDYDLGDPEQDPGLVLKTGEVVYPCDGAGDTCQIDGTPGVCRGPEPLTCIAISNTTTVPTTTISTTRVPETSSSTTNTNVTTTTPASAVSDATPGGDNAASGAASRSDEGSLDTTLIIALAAAASVVLALAVTAAVCYKRSKASKASYNVAETENIRRPKQAHV